MPSSGQSFTLAHISCPLKAVLVTTCSRNHTNMTTDAERIAMMTLTPEWKEQMKQVLLTGIEKECKSCGGTVSHGYLILASGYCLPCKLAGLEYYREEEDYGFRQKDL